MRQIVYFIGIMFLAGCAKGPDMIKSAGETITESRWLESFHSIEAGNKFDIILTQDSSKPEGVSITAGKNLLPKISSKIVNGVLVLEDNNTWNWVRKLRVRIACVVNIKNINELKIHGTASVSNQEQIILPFLDIFTDGVGDIRLFLKGGFTTLNAKNPGTTYLRGSSNILSFSVENGHAVEAKDLLCDDVYVFHFTARDCSVTADKKLGIKMYNKGNLFYHKKPQNDVQAFVAGSGKPIFTP